LIDDLTPRQRNLIRLAEQSEAYIAEQARGDGGGRQPPGDRYDTRASLDDWTDGSLTRVRN